MSYEHLTIERPAPGGDHIATVTFQRPDKANALNYELLSEIAHAAESFREDLDSRVVIFSGAGKHFSSGADLSDPGEAYRVPLTLKRRRSRVGERAIEALLDMDQITIAAWNGAAMGGGGCIATALDFRIGADDCCLRYPEIDIGVNLMWKSLPLLVRLAGPARAKRLVVGGERIEAETLLAWGVLDELVPRRELLTRTRAVARHYASKAPAAAQMIKQSINRLAGALDRAIMHMDVDQNLLNQTSDDRRAAIEAYLAGQPPRFTGN